MKPQYVAAWAVVRYGGDALAVGAAESSGSLVDGFAIVAGFGKFGAGPANGGEHTNALSFVGFRELRALRWSVLYQGGWSN